MRLIPKETMYLMTSESCFILQTSMVAVIFVQYLCHDTDGLNFRRAHIVEDFIQC